MAYGLFSQVRAQPGRREDLLRNLLRAAQLLEADPDCGHYLVATAGDPDLVYVFETWSDQQAHAASLQWEEIRALIEHAAPTVAGMDQQLQLTVRGGKGATP